MRTLKKSLALVLALVMVLGLGVVGASADNALDNYTDTGDIGDAYLEAVGVLTGLGIVDGMTDTTIEPDGTYTRAQAAKIVATMLLGVDAADSLKATTAPFEDVPTYHWASGYIAYCVEAGIIDGMTATTFEPEGTLTGFQWAKMLLSAVGFGVNGEFEGDSWSLNTATVGHQSGLFSGDLDGADHVALRREQAMLYAFNALTKLPQVTYSKENTNYLYGILGYFFADGTGTTLGWDTFDLKSVEGMVVDNEGMGASATYVDSTNAREGDVKIDADTGLDLMYHAVRAWYVNDKNHTNVYVYDMATVESTTCPTNNEISKARAGSAVDATIGEVGDPYELYVIDNSALDIDDASVVLVADYGSFGYDDHALDTTYVTSATNATPARTTVDSDDVMSDVSDLAYGDGIIYLHATSEREQPTATDNKEALYVAPVTSTVGTVSSFDQSGDRFTVTLDDGTEIEESVFFSMNFTNELFRIGQTYTFVLDTHGDVIYATMDGARDLYVWTGEFRNTGNYGDINTDQGVERRFINVTSGEEYWASVYFSDVVFTSTEPNGSVTPYTRGQYFDISTGTNAAGDHRAERVAVGDNTYAAGYVVNNWTAIVTGDDELFVPSVNATGEDVYYDAETITFLVATGWGSSMRVQPYVGVAAFKEALGLPDDGRIALTNAAITVSETLTGDWEASVVFVLNENVDTTSSYVFLAEDIDITRWSSISGDIDNYFITYNDAYMNGVQTSLRFSLGDLRLLAGDGIIERGFYVLSTAYDASGNATYVITEAVDNERGTLCFYQTANFSAIGSDNSTTGWRLNGFRVASDVIVVDTTDPTHDAATVYDAYIWSLNHDNGIAFTVNPVTERVNVIYIVNDGWDARINVSLSTELAAAGWVFIDEDGDSLGTSIPYTDDAAQALGGAERTFSIYNANLAGATTGSTRYTVTVSENDTDMNLGGNAQVGMTNGVIEVKFTPSTITSGTKTYNYEIDGLVIDTVTVTEAADSGRVVTSVTPNEDLILGQKVTVTLRTDDNTAFEYATDGCDLYSHYDWVAELVHNGNNTDYDVTGSLDSTEHVVTFEFYPWHINETYTIANATWEHNA